MRNSNLEGRRECRKSPDAGLRHDALHSTISNGGMCWTARRTLQGCQGDAAEMGREDRWIELNHRQAYTVAKVRRTQRLKTRERLSHVL